MKNKRAILIGVLSVAAALLAVFAGIRGTQPVKAQTEQPPPVHDRISFGTVGITSGQTVRVSVANTLHPNDVNLPPGPVRVVITFRNGGGNLVRNRSGEIIRKAVDLERGDTTFVDLNYDELPPSPIRLQLRAVIVAIPPPVNDSNLPPPVNDLIASTLEVISNANGRTQFAVFTNPAVIRGFNPQPDPPSPE